MGCWNTKFSEFFGLLGPEKTGLNPEILCSNTPIVMGIFNGNILAQKRGQKGKKLDLKHYLQFFFYIII